MPALFPAHINSIATAVPANDGQAAFTACLHHWVQPAATVEKLQQIIIGSGIEHRHTVLEKPFGPPGSGAFYEYGQFPSTQQRMEEYRRKALPLSLQAIAKLPQDQLQGITHLIITSCTGFYAPGIGH